MNKADNLPMSAEEWYESEIKQGYCFMDMFDFAYLYSDYLLSHHINVLAERIADNVRMKIKDNVNDLDMMDDFMEIDKNSIREIAKDYINELNLQSSK